MRHGAALHMQTFFRLPLLPTSLTEAVVDDDPVTGVICTMTQQQCNRNAFLSTVVAELSVSDCDAARMKSH